MKECFVNNDIMEIMHPEDANFSWVSQAGFHSIFYFIIYTSVTEAIVRASVCSFTMFIMHIQ